MSSSYGIVTVTCSHGLAMRLEDNRAFSEDPPTRGSGPKRCFAIAGSRVHRATADVRTRSLGSVGIRLGEFCKEIDARH